LEETVDDIMAGSSAIRQSKTILARSREAGRAFVAIGNETATAKCLPSRALGFQSTALPTELPSRDGSERQRLFSFCQIFLWSLTKKKNLTEVFYRQQTP